MSSSVNVSPNLGILPSESRTAHYDAITANTATDIPWLWMTDNK